MPRLRVLAGPNFHDLEEIEANSSKGFPISTDAFDGEIAVYIKGLEGEEGSKYFGHEKRKDKTWSIQFKGRFLQPHTANDLMVGAGFDRPLTLPWGFSAVTAFMQFIDPTLELDFNSDKPSALSPLITTMPHLLHRRVSGSSSHIPFPPAEPIEDDLADLSVTQDNGFSDRKTYFQNPEKRKALTIGPEDLIVADFVHGHLDIGPSHFSVQIPGGYAFDMMQYWEGQPLRFVCCERAQEGDATGGKWGRVFWCVALEAVGEEVDEEDEEEEEADEEDLVGADDID